MKQACAGLLLMWASVTGVAAELSVGLGAVATPDASAQNDWRILPAPSFNWEWNGYRVRTQGPGLAADLAPSRKLTLGPLVRYAGGRDDEDLGATGAGLATVPASVETGLSVGTGLPWRVMRVPLPGIALVQFDTITTLPGGHEGPYAQASLGWLAPVTDRWTLIGTVGASYFSDAYADRFFSVSDGEADAAGVSPLEADAGWQDTRVSLVTTYRWAPRWTALVVTSVSRYQGDAARSPVTRTLDNRNRYALVAGVSYRWLGL